MNFKNGDIAKFKGSKMKILYRVIDDKEFLAHSNIDNSIETHIQIEVMHGVPVKHLVPATEKDIKEGRFAIDVKMEIYKQNN